MSKGMIITSHACQNDLTWLSSVTHVRTILHVYNKSCMLERSSWLSPVMHVRTILHDYHQSCMSEWSYMIITSHVCQNNLTWLSPVMYVRTILHDYHQSCMSYHKDLNLMHHLCHITEQSHQDDHAWPNKVNLLQCLIKVTCTHLCGLMLSYHPRDSPE